MIKKTIELLLSKLKNGDNYQEISADQTSPQIKTIHESERIVDLDGYLDQPRSINQSKCLYQLQSFIDYIEIYKPNADSADKHGCTAIFVSLTETGVHVNAEIDYHKAHDSASHNTHSVELICNEDESFKQWVRYDNDWMNQNQMINLLKKFNNALHQDDFSNLLTAIEHVKSNTKLTETQKAGESGNSKAVFFEMLETFTFSFKPYFSLPMKYSIKADLYVQLDESNRIQLKYSIRNQHTIHEQVASDLMDKFNDIEGVLVF